MEYKSNGHLCFLILAFISLSFEWLVIEEEFSGWFNQLQTICPCPKKMSQISIKPVLVSPS